MLLEPIAEAMIRHKFAESANPSIEWLTVDRNAVADDIGDGMIARFTVHGQVRLTRRSSATAGGSELCCGV